MTDPILKAQERLALHELIRVGVGRQEDLRLLQNVTLQAACLPQTSTAQLLREAALREEWRAGREASLLSSLRIQSFRGLFGAPGGGDFLSAADGRLLAEQIAAFTEMLEQQQQRRRQRAPAHRAGVGHKPGTSRRSSGGRPGNHLTQAAPLGPPPRSTATAPSPPRSYLVPRSALPHQSPHQAATWGGEQMGLHTLSPAGLGPVPGGLLRSASAEARAPLAPYDGVGWPRHGAQVASSSATATTTAAAAIYSAAAAVVGSPARALRSSGGGGGGRRASGAGGAATAASSTSPSWTSVARKPAAPHAAPGSPHVRIKLRPGSAPEDVLAGGEWWGADASAAAAAASAAAAAAAAVNAGGDGSGVSNSGAGPDSGYRCSGFRNLMRLQQLLMQGLREHAQQDGEGGALEALQASVAEGQAFFSDCLAEALEAAGLPPDALGGGASSPARIPGLGAGLGWRGSGSGSPIRRAPPVAWDKLLRLGQLGLTRSDIARLEQIRRQRAARTIQRQVRRWLRQRRHQRRVAEARARADAMQRKLRNRAAVIIQAWVRGHLARRLAAGLAQQAARLRMAQQRAEARRVRAAIRIQRAWRAHRKAVRYRAAMARAEAQRLRELEQQRAAGLDGITVHAGGSDGGQVDRSQRHQQRQQQQALVSRGDLGSRRSQLSVEQAVIVIQAHLRGWLVRRSPELAWVRSSHQLRQRRAGVRAWQQHQRFMQTSYDLQAQLLGALVREAQVVGALQADQRRQEAEMQAAFNEWLVQQQRVALSQPLPRGWVPHPHPEDPARMCFLNTRTGDLHSLHPAMAELARHAQEQHAAASAALAQRFSGVPGYVQQLHAATEQQAAIALKAIAVMYQRAAAIRGEGGPGAGPADIRVQ